MLWVDFVEEVNQFVYDTDQEMLLNSQVNKFEGLYAYDCELD